MAEYKDFLTDDDGKIIYRIMLIPSKTKLYFRVRDERTGDDCLTESMKNFGDIEFAPIKADSSLVLDEKTQIMRAAYQTLLKVYA